MKGQWLTDYLRHMHVAASDACSFVEGLHQEDFRHDKRTQAAVVMNLIVIGEAATKIMDQFPDFASSNDCISWRSLRGMRNRLAHGYFDINLNVVWDTVQAALPALLLQLPGLIQDAERISKPDNS